MIRPFLRCVILSILALFALCSMGLLHAQSDYSGAYAITTLAGGVAPYGSADGTGAAASFYHPDGVSVDASGNVYVADNYNNKIRKITAAGVVTTMAGSGAQGNADGTGTAAGFTVPNSVAVDNSGNVYVTDYYSKIRKITPGGVVTTLAGSGTNGSADGMGTAASFYYPNGVAVDGNGIVYVADTHNNKIRKITTTGVVTTLAGSGTTGSADGTGTAASFSLPSGVAVDASGNIYVADKFSNRIRKITATGVVTTLAGSDASGSADGTGAAASFYCPNGVAVDGSGNIYVADANNHKIRKGMAVPTQTINFAALPSQTYGSTLVLSATASSGLTPTFNIVSGPAALSGNSLTPTGLGVVTVRASQSGNASYAAAPSVDQSFTVTQGTQIIAFGALANKSYGNAAFIVSASSSSGLAPTFSILSGPATIFGNTITLTGGGTVTVRASQAGNVNYAAAAPVDQSFAVAQASQTITFTTLPNKTYGDAAFAVSASSSSGLAPTFSILSGPATIFGNTITLTGVGTVTVRASQAGNVNFAAATPVDQSFTIAQASQTITFATLTNKTYGDAAFTLSASASSGLIPSFSVVSGPATLSGNTLTMTGAGTIVVRASQPGDGNYTAATAVDRSFVVRNTQTITFPLIGDRLLSSPSVALTATASSGLSVTYVVVSGPASVVGSTLTLSGEGSVTVSATQPGDINYVPATAVNQTFTASKATQTITFPAIGNQSVVNLSQTVSVAAGAIHSLFLKADGTVWATGSNYYGELGNGNTNEQPIPIQVMSGVAAIAAGNQSSLFLKIDGTVWAVGANAYGNLGNGNTNNQPIPVQVMSGVAAIAGGYGYNLFLKTDGTVWAVGANTYGQLGNGNTNNQSIPVQVMSGVASVAAGNANSFFLKSDGTVWAAGDNNYGQLGIGDNTNKTIPVQIMGGVASVAGGYGYNLFLKTDGTVWAAGYNDYGQLGNGNHLNQPVPVQVMSGVVSVKAGLHYSLFVKTDGTAWAAGDNTYGQFGNGNNLSQSIPVPVMSGVALLAEGYFHSLFLKTDGTLWAAGNNFHGQLGIGSTTDQNIPVHILDGNSATIVTLAATTPSGLAITYAVVSGPATLNGTTLTLTGEGTVTVSASQAGSFSYSAATTVSQSFTASKVAQTITFPIIGDRLLTNPTVSLSATTTSGLAVAYAVVSGPATLSGTTLTLTGEGTVTMSASQAGTLGYSAAAPVSQSFTASKVAQTITFPVIGNRLLTNPTVSLSATTTSGLAVAYAVVSGPATLSGTTLTLTGEGTVTVSASQSGTLGYSAAAPVSQSFTASKATQTITWTAITNQVFRVPLAIQLTATASSGQPVSYAVVSGPASISNGYLIVSGTGEVTVRASQAGSSAYSAAADVIVTFAVAPNTGPPATIQLSNTWFYDNLASGTEVGILSAVDPDAGDVLSYSLVSGTGATDNAKFTIAGDRLKTAASLSYNSQHSAQVRVRVTDLAGQYVEQAFTLSLVPASPNARFIQKSNALTPLPCYVNVIFQLTDPAGKYGINIPRALFDQSNDIFQVQEAASPTSSYVAVSPAESFLQVVKYAEVPFKVRTVLLLDNSFSVGGNLSKIKDAAKTMIDSMFDQQEIAIYYFSANDDLPDGTPVPSYTLVKDFTGKSAANQVALKAAIDTIGLGNPSTDLYGSVLGMLSLPKWKESFTLTGIETGFLVVLTDGQDTAGLASIDQVVAKRDDAAKKIYTIGIPDVSGSTQQLDAVALQKIGNADYLPVAQIDGLAKTFGDIQRAIQDDSNSYYWLNYASPKRTNLTRGLQVSLKNNVNTASNGTLTTTFNSNGFTSLRSEVVINRTFAEPEGIVSPTPLMIEKTSNTPTTVRAFTILPVFGSPAYTWTIGDPTLATLSPIDSDGGRVTITPKGVDGTTSLTLTDTINFHSKTITLIIGAGNAPEIAVEQPVGTDVANASAKAYGNVLLGTSSSLTFTIKNTGIGNLTGLAITKDGVNASNFTVTAQPLTTVVPGGNTTFIVRFNPDSAGIKNAAIHISNNDANESPFNINLTGTGTAPEIAVEQPLSTNIADSGSKAFGSVAIGSSTSITFTIKNTGNGSLTGLGITKDGTNASDFSITAAPVAPVIAGASTTFTVQFKPGSAGAKTAAIHIANNDANENPFNMILTGAGTAPEIVVQQPVGKNFADGGSKSFGSVAIGATKGLTFSIKNTGTGNLTGLAITKTGATSQFKVTSNPVSPVVPGGSTTFTVKFAPTAKGAKSAALHIANNDSDESPFDINLSGIGFAASSVSPSAAIFATAGLTEGHDGYLIQRRSYTSYDLVDGLKYQTLVVVKGSGADPQRPVVEVSPNLMDWYSGGNHTTILQDDETLLRVRDNLPLFPGNRRYIRLKP